MDVDLLAAALIFSLVIAGAFLMLLLLSVASAADEGEYPDESPTSDVEKPERNG